MVINFKTRGISRGARKLTQTSTLIIIIKKNNHDTFTTIAYKIPYFNANSNPYNY
jgi:hypothetical protein